MTTGSKGPWRVDPDGWDDDGLCIMGGGPIGSMSEHAVAWVQNYGQGFAVCEEDAALIANAPLLREFADASGNVLARLELEFCQFCQLPPGAHVDGCPQHVMVHLWDHLLAAGVVR